MSDRGKHFNSFYRCSAVGVMAAVTFFGVAVAPFVMKIDPFHPIVPLGIMGGLAILSALLSYFMLPETKGTNTRETVDDSENFSIQCSSNRSPKIHRRARHASDDSGRDSPEGGSGEELMENNENDARDTGSLAVSFYFLSFILFIVETEVMAVDTRFFYTT